MYLDHRITVKIARILNMIDMSALLLDNTGSVLLPEGDTRTFTMPDDVLHAPTVPFIYGGVTLIGTADEQPVFICLQGTSEDVQKCALLCAELINMLIHEQLSETNRSQSVRLMMRNEVEGGEFECLANAHDIPMEQNRCVLYFYFPDIDSGAAIGMLQDALDDEHDILTDVGQHAVAMLKNLPEDSHFEELEEYVTAIENSFLAESGIKVIIGVSEPHKDLFELPDAYNEARNAINVGRIFHASRQIFFYRNLLLERFLNSVPAELCQDYNKSIFNRKTTRLFNEEMIHTIEVFFDNSLNLSETARKLYIHRNTLVYRLEKIQNAIGLDLRNFDDAVTFKMMMLLGKNEGSHKFRL